MRLIAALLLPVITCSLGVNYDAIPPEHHPAIERAIAYYEALGYAFEFAACAEDTTLGVHWWDEGYYARSLFTHPEPRRDDIILSSRYDLGDYLATVVAHEIGHILGIWEHGDELMAPFPAAGARLSLRDQRRLRGVHRFVPDTPSGLWK